MDRWLACHNDPFKWIEDLPEAEDEDEDEDHDLLIAPEEEENGHNHEEDKEWQEVVAPPTPESLSTLDVEVKEEELDDDKPLITPRRSRKRKASLDRKMS